MNLGKTELASYSFLLLGISIDQFSTRLGLSRYNLVESNIFAARLMNFGVWGYYDLLVSLAFIGITYISYRKTLAMKNDLVFVLPVISGTVRLFAGLMNIVLF